jgi:hypothetical protein
LLTARPFLAYVLTVVSVDLMLYVGSNAAQTTELADVTRGLLVVGALLALFLIPAATLTIHAIARLGTSTAIVRAVVGMLSWAGWVLFVAAAVVVAGTIGLWPEGFGALLVILGVAGAVFGVLGVSASQGPPRRAVTIVAGVIGLVITAGCFVTVGWWGSAT